MNYKTMNTIDAIHAVNMGANINELLHELWEAGNEDTYFELDARADKYYR